MTREHVTVSLSGDGGDELFCGYGRYSSINRIWGKMKNVPYPVRKLASNLILHGPMKLNKVQSTKAMLLGAKGAEELYELSNEEEPLAKEISIQKQMLPFKYTQYPTGYLKETKNNIMLMDMLMYHPDEFCINICLRN